MGRGETGWTGVTEAGGIGTAAGSSTAVGDTGIEASSGCFGAADGGTRAGTAAGGCWRSGSSVSTSWGVGGQGTAAGGEVKRWSSNVADGKESANTCLLTKGNLDSLKTT